jgi:hypothetical protein
MEDSLQGAVNRIVGASRIPQDVRLHDVVDRERVTDFNVGVTGFQSVEDVAQESLEPDAQAIAPDDEIALLLARFFQKGYLPRAEARRLMDPQVRSAAEQRLNAVGLALAWSPYSRYYGLTLADGPAERAERITNLAELDRNALALLVILWARLVLPQRLAEEGREGGVSEPVVAFETLNAEFGKKLGGRRFEMYVSQLRRLGFLEYSRKDEIKAGPFLDLLGDANQLASYLRQSTIARVVGEGRVVEEAEVDESIAGESVG